MMPTQQSDADWRVNWLKPRLPWGRPAALPAEIAEGLCRVMLARENLLEDVNYTKIACNHFVVELSPDNYRQRYQPLEANLLWQWREKLVDCLLTANSRQGRQAYRFGGQVRIELRAAADLAEGQARVLCRVAPELAPAEAPARERRQAVAVLEWIDGQRRWPLYPGHNVIGRDQACDVFLDLPAIQEKPLVSGRHATIHAEGGQCLLYDGSPAGKPSANGTYLNSRRVSTQGAVLQDGDVIILAALDPQAPRADTPGVAAFRFWAATSGAG